VPQSELATKQHWGAHVPRAVPIVTWIFIWLSILLDVLGTAVMF